MLDLETNDCKIYEYRPPICDVEGMYERRAEPLGMSWVAWTALNAGLCAGMIDAEGMDPEWYPKIKKVGLVQLEKWTAVG